MDDREKILTRIRDALQVPAPRPGAHGGASLDQAEDVSRRDVPDYSDWLPAVGKDFAARAALFAQLSAGLKTEFFFLESEEELRTRFRKLVAEEAGTRVAAHRGALTELTLRGSGLNVLYTDDGYQIADLEACGVGLTECESLVAQTGSVLVSSRASGGRALSVLPPHHVVVARASQMAGDLTEAYARLREKYGADYPSFLSFVTGPSRTGDIERILVLGAHGPKRLTVFCLPA